MASPSTSPATRYRQLLVRTLHAVCIKFPDTAASVIPILMDFLSDNNELAATDVLVRRRDPYRSLYLIYLISLIRKTLRKCLTFLLAFLPCRCSSARLSSGSPRCGP